MPFTIKNLDTGEATSVPLGGMETASYGALQPRSEAREAVKAACRGLLEKLQPHLKTLRATLYGKRIHAKLLRRFPHLR